ncbi:MAG: hypothetical protein HY011_19020 [Acidobacteria bacterium]|nr:hypothetical protein [Acidobacteriota bacterium]
MQLQPQTDAALAYWLGIETWYKGHAADEGRFFDFVNAYAQEHGFVINEAELQGEIERRVSGARETISEPARATIRQRVSLAYNILDFLRHTGR